MQANLVVAFAIAAAIYEWRHADVEARVMTIYGDIKLNDEFVFKYYNEEGAEIYGWIEKNWDIVKGSAGWYRTADPAKAALIAKSNLDQ